ncbi:MAG: hypothetical protein JOY59_00110 [Candidatus Eremiobacteraeota bacterium]|nr:hypothetical protein [Candidatus Eremiobacteraeota bacterium]
MGAGTMGTGIAMAAANAAVDVVLLDLQPGALGRARDAIGRQYATSVAKGKLTQDDAERVSARIAFAGGLDAVSGAGAVIEAVFEEMDVKQDVFRALDRIAAPGALLATNTSTLDVDAIAAVTSRPQDVLGLHFFSPAHVMKLLEIVRGAKSSEATIERGRAFAARLGKVGVVAGNCDGFIGNRMLHPYLRETIFMVEEGATPAQIDRVMTDFGFAMGPFQMGDLAGLDVGWRIRKRKLADGSWHGRYPHLADRVCELGRYGQKTGAGWYRYEPGSREPHEDPLVEALAAECAREAGIARGPIDDDEILERALRPLYEEGEAILREGIASGADDIDTVWRYGYGFPAALGGPMQWGRARWT